jgi:hypothetical protein
MKGAKAVAPFKKIFLPQEYQKDEIYLKNQKKYSSLLISNIEGLTGKNM